MKTWMQEGDSNKNLGAANHLLMASTSGKSFDLINNLYLMFVYSLVSIWLARAQTLTLAPAAVLWWLVLLNVSLMVVGLNPINHRGFFSADWLLPRVGPVGRLGS